MTPNELFDKWCASNNITKAEGVIDTTNANFGGILPVKTVQNMISLSRAQNQFMGAITTMHTASPSGTYPIIDGFDVVSEAVGENDLTPVTSTIGTRGVDYRCGKILSQHIITTEQIETAAAAGMTDFEQQMDAEFALALGNDWARLAINGDTSLPATNRLNKLLRRCDGFKKQLAAGANVQNCGGKVLDNEIWSAMLASMPEQYRQDGNLAWMYNSMTDIVWHKLLTYVDSPTTTRDQAAADVLLNGSKKRPLNMPTHIVNQISAMQGPTPVAPTSAAAQGAGIRFVLTALVADATVATGRLVKVTFKGTSKSETIAITRVSNQNVIDTTGILGQSAVSTTATDYEVTFADETNIWLGNPKGLHFIIWLTMRAYRRFNPVGDRWEIFVFNHVDCKVPTPETFVDFQRVQVLPPTKWAA